MDAKLGDGADPGRVARSGALAGLVSVLVFTIVHDLVISDIWAMLPIMAVAGAACGASLGWSYALLVPRPAVASWLAYTGTYLAMFGVLGGLSLMLYEPVTTMAAITARGGPIDDLIAIALPMTIAFTLGTALLVSLLFGRRLAQLGAVLVTTIVLVLFLGLNISAIGLVEFTVESAVLVAELFGLTALLGVVFAVAFLALEWRSLATSPTAA